MKRTIIFAAALSSLVLASCERDEIAPVLDARVTLDAGNTYRAGEPVRFLVEGNADYITFWSGETGHEYRYRDRKELSSDDVESVTLTLGVMARYGTQYGSLKIGVSDGFGGLLGQDDSANGKTGTFDKQLIAGFGDVGEADGWASVGYETRDIAANSDKTVEWTTDVTEYIDNFSMALHWRSTRGDATQRTYYVTPTLTLRYKNGFPDVTLKASDLGFTALSLAQERAADVYDIKKTSKGSVSFTNTMAPLYLQGASANDLKYAIHTWCISTPMKLNRIDPDKGVNIKTLNTDLRSYEYKFDAPGTYTVSFVMNSGNYTGHKGPVVQELTVTVE